MYNELHVNTYKGLSQKEVEEAAKRGWINRYKKDSESSLFIFIEHIFSYFNFIFAVLAFLLILVGSYKSLTFLPVIIANTCIGIIHKIRAKRYIDKLKFLHTDRVKIIRDGKLSQIGLEEIVKNDIVLFESGDQIYADSVVIEGTLTVNESLVTGEADDIEKSTRSELLSGSYVTSGCCIAEITAVGEYSYVNRLSLDAKSIKHKKNSKMLHDIDRIIAISGISIIPIGALLFYQQFFLDHSTLNASVTSMVAAVIGMIPEGLYLLANVTLAISSALLAKKNVLVQEMRALELLARADVLCLDKTGTITNHDMVVEKVIVSGAYPDDLIELPGLLSFLADSLPKDNPTIHCIYKKYHSDKKTGIVTEKVIPFRSKTKYSQVITNIGSFKLGAPEFLLREELSEYLDFVNSYAKKGYRILAVTRDDREFLGIVVMSNPMREGAKEILRHLRENHIDIKIISGDNPITVSEIAQKAEIRDWDKFIDMSTLHPEADFNKIVDKFTIFGRTDPYQKRDLIRALQKNGKTVAMVGDGINDVLALKTADCSFAMFSGSKAACHASTMVLLNSDFSKMPDIIKEGRRVVNNIERSAALFLYKNIFSFLLAVLSILSVSAYPLLPSQVAFIGAFTIGIPGFLLSREKNYNIIKGSFLLNVFKKAVVPALTAFVSIGSLSFLNSVLWLENRDLSVISALIYAFTGLYNIYRISKPLNRFRSLILTVCTIGMFSFIVWFGAWFDIVILNGNISGIIFSYFLIVPILFSCFEKLLQKILLLFTHSKKSF